LTRKEFLLPVDEEDQVEEVPQVAEEDDIPEALQEGNSFKKI
jgi:hypothetical protein